MTFLKIYLWGVAVAICLSAISARDSDGKIDLWELGIMCALSLASWSMVLGLLFGMLIKHNKNKTDNSKR